MIFADLLLWCCISMIYYLLSISSGILVIVMVLAYFYNMWPTLPKWGISRGMSSPANRRQSPSGMVLHWNIDCHVFAIHLYLHSLIFTWNDSKIWLNVKFGWAMQNNSSHFVTNKRKIAPFWSLVASHTTTPLLLFWYRYDAKIWGFHSVNQSGGYMYLFDK